MARTARPADVTLATWNSSGHQQLMATAQTQERTTMPTSTSSIKRALDALLDRLPSRRQAQHREQLGPVPDFLFPERDSSSPSSEVGTKSPMPVRHVVTPDLEIITFDDGHELKIPRSRKRR